MITQAMIVPLLLEGAPSFHAAVEEHQAFYGGEITYPVLGDFARHLLELYRQNHTAEFPKIAAVIERLHTEGDEYVKEAATIGVLEGIQNVWGNQNVDPELFTRYLLPESRKWWDELNAFWRGERRYVGEGLQREITADEVCKIQAEIRAFNEKLKKKRENET